MYKRLADIYDVIILVFAMAICMITGIGTSVRDYTEIKSYEANLQDKTAGDKNGQLKSTYGNYDGTCTRDRMLLTTQIQDYDMTDHDAIDYKNKSGDTYTFDISSTYKDNCNEIEEKVLKNIAEDGLNKYRAVYDPVKKRYVFSPVQQ